MNGYGPRVDVLPVTDIQSASIGKLLNLSAERRQPFIGCDEEYIDLGDYILRCTLKLWGMKHRADLHALPTQQRRTHGGTA